MLPWVVALLVALLVLMPVTSTWCPPGELSLALNQGHPKLQSLGIRSRSPTVKPRETTATTSAAAPTRTVLKTFEVAPPVLMPDGPADSDGSTRHGKDYSPELCTVLLMRHDFAWSYNAPFVGKPG